MRNQPRSRHVRVGLARDQDSASYASLEEISGAGCTLVGLPAQNDQIVTFCGVGISAEALLGEGSTN